MTKYKIFVEMCAHTHNQWHHQCYMGKNIQYELFTEEEIGTNLFGINDSHTGYSLYTSIAYLTNQYPSLIAFAGARYSRSALPVHELLLEIKGSKKKAQERLADIFKNYGHASVGDMADLFVYLQNISILSAFFFFYNTSVGAGQERSSRYQDYRKSSLIPLHFFVDRKTKHYDVLEQKYKDLEAYALHCYEKYIEILTESYGAYFGLDNDAAKTSALKSRVFDSARSFLLLGFRTSLAYITSAREWSRIISELKSREGILYDTIGEQLEELLVSPQFVSESMGFAPESPDLIRHTEANLQVKKNLNTLRKYLEEKTKLPKQLQKENHYGEYIRQSVCVIDTTYSPSEIILAQYILALYPDTSFASMLVAIQKLSLKAKKEMSGILFAGHTNYIQMDNIARTGAYSMHMKLSIGEARDLNRHRSMGRFTPLFAFPRDTECFMQHGFTLPLYLTENKAFSNIQTSFIQDMSLYYTKLKDFITLLQGKNVVYDQGLVLSLLPMGTTIDYMMHGSMKEFSYITNQRVRPGGHINYRMLAYDMADALSKADPLLSGIALSHRPDPLSKEEFFDRS